MAIVNNGTRLLIPTRQVPVGITIPAVTTFDDIQYRRTLELTVLKSDVESTTQAATMDKIVTEPVVGITPQVTAIITEDFIGTEDVSFWADIVSLTSTNTPDGGTDPWLTDVAPSYVMNVVIYVKSN